MYGHGPSLEDFMQMTPLSVGSPQEIIDNTIRAFSLSATFSLCHTAIIFHY